MCLLMCRQVRALTAAKAMAAGDAVQMTRWENEAKQLLQTKGSLSHEWTKAYWLLHKELKALREVLDAYWAAARG